MPFRARIGSENHGFGFSAHTSCTRDPRLHAAPAHRSCNRGSSGKRFVSALAVSRSLGDGSEFNSTDASLSPASRTSPRSPPGLPHTTLERVAREADKAGPGALLERTGHADLITSRLSPTTLRRAAQSAALLRRCYSLASGENATTSSDRTINPTSVPTGQDDSAAIPGARNRTGSRATQATSM